MRQPIRIWSTVVLHQIKADHASSEMNVKVIKEIDLDHAIVKKGKPKTLALIWISLQTDFTDSVT